MLYLLFNPQGLISNLKASHESGFLVLIAIIACVQALVSEIQPRSRLSQ